MNRRYIYISAFVVLIPVILWIASAHSDLPRVTFAEASAIADTVQNSRVLVPGLLDPAREVSGGGDGITFYLKDGSGAMMRVVYDGSEEVDVARMNNMRQAGEDIQVAGHMCSDGEGPRFHAKNLYLN